MTIDDLIENFELLGDWEERYAYLIDLGKKLPGLPDADKTEENRVHGCQAMVWLKMNPDSTHPDRLQIQADSDAFIVRGLIAVVMILFNGKTPTEILHVDGKAIFSKLGLDQHLSATRKNGLFSMIERIHTLAAAKAVNVVTTA